MTQLTEIAVEVYVDVQRTRSCDPGGVCRGLSIELFEISRVSRGNLLEADLWPVWLERGFNLRFARRLGVWPESILISRVRGIRSDLPEEIMQASERLRAQFHLQSC